MAKTKVKTSFFCKNCGSEFSKWMGKCSACGEWNTIIEEVLQVENKKAWKEDQGPSKARKPQAVRNIKFQTEHRIDMKNDELNRVLGGGLVPGSLVLVGGEPGIGKSTLILQVALQMVGQRILYVSGEESEQQIKMRAERIGIKNEECFILNETRTQNIFQQVKE
ncbi:MAG: DNA repair protein RadA, partial [Bacteroidetes bacterium]